MNLDGIETAPKKRREYLLDLRNQIIHKLYTENELPATDIAFMFNQSNQRVYQILNKTNMAKGKSQ